MNSNNRHYCNFLAHDTISNAHGQLPANTNFSINHQVEVGHLQMHQASYDDYQDSINPYNPYPYSPYYVPLINSPPEATVNLKQPQPIVDLIYNNEFYSDGVDNHLFPLSPISFQSLDSFEDLFHHQTHVTTPHQEFFPRVAVNIDKYTSPPTRRRRTNPSQLKCMICLKTFSRPYNLKSHQRTHTKERPFKCVHPECGWTFARPHDLKRHELLHSGIKPHVCSCGKKFSRSDAFKRHRQVDPTCVAVNETRKRNRRS